MSCRMDLWRVFFCSLADDDLCRAAPSGRRTQRGTTSDDLGVAVLDEAAVEVLELCDQRISVDGAVPVESGVATHGGVHPRRENNALDRLGDFVRRQAKCHELLHRGGELALAEPVEQSDVLDPLVDVFAGVVDHLAGQGHRGVEVSELLIELIST